MKFCLLISLPVLLSCMFLSSCSKGYEVQFTNYYIEPMDSVVIGNDLIVFTNIDPETSTAYHKIQKGNHTVKCISRSKRVFYSVLNIAGSGSGKRDIQIDGINQIAVLEN